MGAEVYTARISYSGADRFDVTRKSGGVKGAPFAPSWAILRPVLDKRRAGTITDDDWVRYCGEFGREMRASYRANRPAWDALLAREMVTLVCYCTDAQRCHRTLLAASILPTLGAVYRGER